MSVEASQELFQHLEAHSMSPSDVRLVHHMKTLLLVRDTESLQHALERLPACCAMPPGTYWAPGVSPRGRGAEHRGRACACGHGNVLAVSRTHVTGAEGPVPPDLPGAELSGPDVISLNVTPSPLPPLLCW